MANSSKLKEKKPQWLTMATATSGSAVRLSSIDQATYEGQNLKLFFKDGRALTWEMADVKQAQAVFANVCKYLGVENPIPPPKAAPPRPGLVRPGGAPFS